MDIKQKFHSTPDVETKLSSKVNFGLHKYFQDLANDGAATTCFNEIDNFSPLFTARNIMREPQEHDDKAFLKTPEPLPSISFFTRDLNEVLFEALTHYEDSETRSFYSKEKTEKSMKFHKNFSSESRFISARLIALNKML
jgi:hypothetical protein